MANMRGEVIIIGVESELPLEFGMDDLTVNLKEKSDMKKLPILAALIVFPILVCGQEKSSGRRICLPDWHCLYHHTR